MSQAASLRFPFHAVATLALAAAGCASPYPDLPEEDAPSAFRLATTNRLPSGPVLAHVPPASRLSPARSRPEYGGSDGGAVECTAGESQPCTTTCGSGGHAICDEAGRWGPCQPPEEICGNGEDDNCDDRVDEGCGPCTPGEEQACETACGSSGTRSCNSADGWGPCRPPAEICGNGRDDNCDGRVDEGCAECTPGQREACTATCGSTGSRACDSAGKWMPCQPPAEVCGNGRDDNCDGRVDEGCAECTPGQREACTATCGSTGTRACDTAGKWMPCQPPAEVCGNGRDDDCDGRVDEGCVVQCEDTLGGRCGNDPGYGNCCSPECNVNGCDPDKFWAWCNRRNPAYPDIWYNFLRDWVDRHCDGEVILGDFDGDGYETFACTASNGVTYTCNTPLILSFQPGAPVVFRPGGSGFSLSPDAGSACFDWPTAATPWLAMDRDRNGAIEDGSELFGSATRIAGGLARHGFEALAELDQNGDGWIDRRDEAWGRVLAWFDGDGDGLSQPDELVPIEDLGLVAISLDYAVRSRCDEQGNCERERAVFWWRDGGELRAGEVIDVHLVVRHGCPHHR